MIRSRANIALLLSVILVCGAAGAASTHRKRDLIRILQQQGFSGALTGDIHFTPLGTLHCRSRDLQAIYFEWYGPAQPSSHRAHYRVLLLDDRDRYLGSYVVQGRPKSVGRGSIVLDHYDAPVRIPCDQIVLGETVELPDGGELKLER